MLSKFNRVLQKEKSGQMDSVVPNDLLDSFFADANVWQRPFRFPVFNSTGPFARWFLHRMRDERDFVFVRVAMRLSAVLVPVAVVFYVFPEVITWYVALAYLVLLNILGFEPYILMLHATEHRPVFKRQYRWLNHYIPWVLGPFFGQTPNSFKTHHNGMHHAESNRLADLSSTRAYRRDSIVHWLHYWARFFFGGTSNMIRYFKSRHRKKYLKMFVWSELSWVVAFTVLMALQWKATLVLFGLPLILVRILFMVGNWAQHAFVDSDDPGNEYRNSTTITNSGYNQRCYNDGYHVVHHLKPGMHWSEMADEFEKNRQRYAAEDAIVFDTGIGDHWPVFFYLMTGRYNMLERHLWRPSGDTRTSEERIAMLKQRVQSQRGSIKRLFEH